MEEWIIYLQNLINDIQNQMEAIHQMPNHTCLRNQWIKRKQDESPKISYENPIKAGSNYSETEVSLCFSLFYLS